MNTVVHLNTKKGGVYEFFVYPDKETGSFVGVCLTLDIVEEGKNPQVLMNSLLEAATGHILTVIKENLSDDLLNRPAPKEYWNKYESFKRIVQTKKQAKRTPAFISGASAQQKFVKQPRELINA